MAVSPDNTRVATASADRTVKLWTAPGYVEPVTLSASADEVSAVAFSADGKRLAAAGKDSAVVIYAVKVDDLLACAKSATVRRFTAEEAAKYFRAGVPPEL